MASKNKRSRLGLKVLSGKLTVDEARAKLGRKKAQKTNKSAPANKSVSESPAFKNASASDFDWSNSADPAVRLAAERLVPIIPKQTLPGTAQDRLFLLDFDNPDPAARERAKRSYEEARRW